MKTVKQMQDEATRYIESGVAKKGYGYIAKIGKNWTALKIYNDHMYRPVVYPSKKKAVEAHEKSTFFEDYNMVFYLEGAVMDSPGFEGAKLMIPIRLIEKIPIKKYIPPRTRIIDGEKYIISAATRKGVFLGDAEYNQKYLKKLGFKTRRFKVGNYYYVYARKV